VKEVWKSVNIWRSYRQYCSALFFFDSQCIMKMHINVLSFWWNLHHPKF